MRSPARASARRWRPALHAAEAILAQPASDADADADAAVRSDYAARVLALKPRFELYEEANRANAHPWLVDLLVWSAQAQPAPRPAHGRRARGDAHPDRRGHACAACCGACSTGADAASVLRRAVEIEPRLKRHRRGRHCSALANPGETPWNTC